MDPRAIGMNDPKFIDKKLIPADGYSRTKQQRKRENDVTDPYFREIDQVRNLGIV